jgi:O-methyltransferase
MRLTEKLQPQAKSKAATAIKTIAYRTGLHRIVFYRYDYMFRPRELATLVSLVSETHGLPGPILEIGCAAGHTTVYLNQHLDDLDDSRSYYCLDTFEGFTEVDIAVEADRGHDPDLYRHLFRAYRKEWFDRTMANNGVTRVTSIKTDVTEFDFGVFDQVSFCLIDVDLKRPVARALEGILPRMAPGGVIVVDDCTSGVKYDGALDAYTEAMEQHGWPVDILHDKLGLIRIPT